MGAVSCAPMHPSIHPSINLTSCIPATHPPVIVCLEHVEQPAAHKAAAAAVEAGGSVPTTSICAGAPLACMMPSPPRTRPPASTRLPRAPAHLMMFSWLFISCRNMISRNVLCTHSRAGQAIRQQRQLGCCTLQQSRCRRQRTSRHRPPPHLGVGGVLEGVENFLQRHHLLGLLVHGFPHNAIGLRATEAAREAGRRGERAPAASPLPQPGGQQRPAP